MTSRRRHTSALVSVIGVLAAGLLVASPAAAEPPTCDVVDPEGTGVLLLREGKAFTVTLYCDAYSVRAQDLQLTVSVPPLHGTASSVTFIPQYTGADYGRHEVTYDPDDDYLGTDQFVLDVSDGTESSLVTVDLLMESNRAPSCNQRDAVYDHVRVDQTWSMTLTCDDLDLQDYGDLEPTVDVEPAHGTLDLAVEEGQYGLDELTLTYAPDPGFTGSDHFVAGATDGDLADLGEFFLNVADGPWCHPSDPVEVRAGATVRILPYCTAPGWEELATAVPTAPEHGSTVFVRMAIDYTADPAASGPDSFTFQATGTSGSSNVVTQQVTITPNAAPVCVPVTTTTPRDTPVDVSLSCSDPDGDEIEVTVTGGPAHGTLTPLVDGTMTYSPDEGYDGTDTFTVEAADFARSSAPTTVTVAVTEEDAPVITVSVEAQSPAQTARRGLLAGVYASEPVTADVVVRVPARVAQRLDLRTRVIGTLTDDAEDLTRLTVPLTRRAARAVRDVRRLPLRVTVTATDEWGNATTKGRRTVLR